MTKTCRLKKGFTIGLPRNKSPHYAVVPEAQMESLLRCSPQSKLLLSVALALPVLVSTRPAFATTNPTTTTLSVTSAGSAVTTIGSGTPITLTAAVVSGATKVTTGQVNFCDASVSYCTDIHLLGTAQLTSAGTAVLKFLPTPGSRSYKAVFVGTQTNAASTSSTATLTVTGLLPSIVTFTTNFQPGTPALTATVGGAGATAPTGNVSLLNASNNNAVLGTATLGTGTAGLAFLNAGLQYNQSPTTLDLRFLAAAVGDFNGDGFLDIVGTLTIPNYGTGNATATATAVLGDGHGNFTAAASTDIGQGPTTIPIAVGDFNADGILDVVTGSGSTANESLTISLGKGDGTFSAGQNVSIGTFNTFFVVADFNKDGIPDVAVLNTTSALVTLFLGNGDGTVTASPEAPTSTGSDPCAIAAGDFNGDGIPDLAISTNCGNDVGGSLTILLGNGNGTFTAAASPATGAAPEYIATGDFNGDGKLDLAVANLIGGTVTILLGNGDGTFTPANGSPVTVTTGGTSAGFMATGDFNGDGRLDLLVTPFGVLLGSGDGTFTLTPAVGLLTSSGLAAGDFNGDSLTDLANDSTALMGSTHTATTPATQVTLPPATGSQLVVASYLGDSNYTTATSGAMSLPAGQGTPAVTLSSSSNSIPLGGSVTFTATVAPIAVEPTGTVMFYDGSAQLGTGSLNSSGVATFTTTVLAVGTHNILASYGGDTNYSPASSAVSSLMVTSSSIQSTVVVTPSSTSINFTQPLTVTVAVSGPSGGATPTGTVALASGTYSAQQSLVNGSASFTIAAGTLSVGANTITANYSGDGTYATQIGTASVTMSDISLAIPAPSAISAGASVTATATITTGASYSGTLNLTCALTSSPAGAQNLPACSLNPTSVTLKSGASGTSVVTVTTTAASSTASLHSLQGSRWKLGGEGMVLATLLLSMLPIRRRRRMPVLVLALLFTASLTSGCGSGAAPPTGTTTPGTTAGSYTFTVTGTDSANAATRVSGTVVVVVQ